MRLPRAVVAAAAAVLLAAAGCTTEVTGTAVQDLRQPPLGLSEDGSGIVAGYPDAPVQLEVYTEPQCTHCADFQAEFGDDIHRYINLGQLAVTYRPLTFLDEGYTDGHSARVANAMFLAVGVPAEAADGDFATGPEFQRFVQELWANQDPGGPGPSDADMADMAKAAGMPDDVAAQIGDGEVAPNVDIAEAAIFNYGALIGVDPITTGTPTVYDLDMQEKINIQDDDWLDTLMSSA
ncbi:protein-disulfide isomerase [Mycolicibacterium agri]|uniref:Protein disulfide-isomerase n=1 Tax=Mycolicibacterium agri TaxID=36811 RepID=A0A2A7N8P0_MYCAG|nr:thioredoxin domain-containing protein [Mycolicibacterium agri]PEG39798.1 protein-disulfide isomerase [Mycolicibacterium agri]GFG52485.1 protein disulfide-isomerase [Mycolicibacterium agri]